MKLDDDDINVRLAFFIVIIIVFCTAYLVISP